VDKLACLADARNPVLATVRSRGFRGRLGHLVRPLAERGAIAMAMASTPLVVPGPQGGNATVGTNPVALGVPIDGGVLVADFTTASRSFAAMHFEGKGGFSAQTTQARTWGGNRGWALSLAVQALVAQVVGVVPATEWGLVIVTIPSTSLGRVSAAGLHDWVEMTGRDRLPGSRSRRRYEEALMKGALIPAWLWNWLCKGERRRSHRKNDSVR
jgi:LDH2 family malate/lactate/ureidoglycolate dehydrogenase